MTHDPGEHDMAMVMPFTVVASAGGPYDDQAFIAGFQAGQVDKALQVAAAAGATELRVTVFSTLVGQLELVGMRHGFGHVVVDESAAWPQWSTLAFAYTGSLL